MKKIIIPGLMAGIAMLAVGMAVSYTFSFLFPAISSEYQNPGLFRPWSDPIMSIYFLHPFLVGIILAWIWDLTKGITKGKTSGERGVYFGLIYWVVTIPGMVISYSTFPVSLLLIFSWSAAGFVESICAGFILSRMNKP